MNHELKILPCYFDAVLSGRKTFEIRDNSDRGFQAGDMVMLKEYNPAPDGKPAYTGRFTKHRIGYVSAFEQKPNWVVFSLLPPDTKVL